MTFTYSHSWRLKAAPDKVFRALTNPAELTRWFAEDADVEPRAGGVFRFWGRHTLGTPPHEEARQTVARFEPNKVLAFDWPINEVDTTVTILLAPSVEGTTLSLTHIVNGDLGISGQRAVIEEHWLLAIGNLAAYLAGGSPAMRDYFNPS